MRADDPAQNRSNLHASGDAGSRPVAFGISVIIKALNEERHIARAIESVEHALACLPPSAGPGEIILADGGSQDRTVTIAREHGIRIVRLADGETRSCGTGPQLGYQNARGAFICLIDGDMVLDAGFLPAALAVLDADPKVAGVGGGVRDVNVVNLEFKRRAVRGAADLRPGVVDRLSGGGLYRRAAIESVGYFSDRNLHGHEEYDLGVRLRAAGWGLRRLARPFVDHYGHVIGGYRLLSRRMRSRYLDGSGEVLRAALGKPHLNLVWRDLPELRLWFAILFAWLAGALAFIALAPGVALAAFAGFWLVAVAVMALRYRSLPIGCYAVVAWNAHAFGMVRGLLRARRDPALPIASSLIEASPVPADRQDREAIRREPEDFRVNARPPVRNPGSEHVSSL